MTHYDINTSQYRYERKFFINDRSTHDVTSIVKLHPAIFSNLYQPRYINNIYFDTINFTHFKDNIEGTTNRIKIRIRWYGPLFGTINNPVLEIKVKKGLLGKKYSIALDSFDLTESTDINDILKSIDTLKKDLPIDFKALTPTLLNRYARTYHQTGDKKYRITIDSQQIFYRIQTVHNTFLEQYHDKQNVILELKYNQSHDCNANRIVSQFPFRVSKSSKYVQGVQRIHGLF